MCMFLRHGHYRYRIVDKAGTGWIHSMHLQEKVNTFERGICGL